LYKKRKNAKSVPSNEAHTTALISIFSYQPDTSLHCETTVTRASASHGVPVYVPAFAGTQCAYPRRDGQAELTWVAGYIPGWSPIQVLTGPGVD